LSKFHASNKKKKAMKKKGGRPFWLRDASGGTHLSGPHSGPSYVETRSAGITRFGRVRGRPEGKTIFREGGQKCLPQINKGGSGGDILKVKGGPQSKSAVKEVWELIQSQWLWTIRQKERGRAPRQGGETAQRSQNRSTRGKKEGGDSARRFKKGGGWCRPPGSIGYGPQSLAGRQARRLWQGIRQDPKSEDTCEGPVGDKLKDK